MFPFLSEYAASHFLSYKNYFKVSTGQLLCPPVWLISHREFFCLVHWYQDTVGPAHMELLCFICIPHEEMKQLEHERKATADLTMCLHPQQSHNFQWIRGSGIAAIDAVESARYAQMPLFVLLVQAVHPMWCSLHRTICMIK